jgi:hypothetical protein
LDIYWLVLFHTVSAMPPPAKEALLGPRPY